jgi:hypothetical protein
MYVLNSPRRPTLGARSLTNSSPYNTINQDKSYLEPLALVLVGVFFFFFIEKVLLLILGKESTLLPDLRQHCPWSS